MSALITSAVFEHSKSLFGDLLTLLAIAYYADDNGKAWPSVKTIAERVRLSERQVQYSIASLVKAGELRVDHRVGPRGRNLFTVLFTVGVQSTSPQVQSTSPQVQSTSPGVQSASPNGTSPSLAPFSPLEPPTIPKPSLSRTVNGHSAPLAVSEDFKAFWAEYPRRDAMKDAVRAWNKAHPKLEVVLEALRKAKRTPSWNRGKQYIPLPATYINGERWDDEL